MTRMTGPDCVVMCNLINTHTHTHTHTPGQGFGSLITRAKPAIIETWVLRVAGWLSFILC